MINIGDKYESDDGDTFVIVGTGIYPRGDRWYRYQSLKYPGDGAIIHEAGLMRQILIGELIYLPSVPEKFNRLETIE